MSNKKVPVNKFKLAVESTPDISKAFQVGLKAFEADHSKKIKYSSTIRIDGSVNIDDAVRTLYSQNNRWDYALGFQDKVVFIEVHSAETGEVSKMLAKLDWLKYWLLNKAPELYKMKSRTPYIWIQSGRFNIPKHMPQRKVLVSKGLMPISTLNLSSVL